jgi:ankyrin repeat protein/L-ascorbate metabolism protein UlaG (beta-lactamase superfamily)
MMRNLTIRFIGTTVSVLVLLVCSSAPAFSQTIHDAVGEGDLAAVKAILAEDPELLESRNEWGATPLIAAAFSGQFDVLVFLHSQGADLGAAHERGGTALHFASLYGHTDIVKFLVDAGADVSIRDDEGFAPVNYACYKGRLEMIEMLGSKGASLKHEGEAGISSFHSAAYGGQAEVVHFLADKGYDPNAGLDQHGHIALMAAAYNRDPKVAQALIERGADVDATNDDGITALHRAALFSADEVAALLIDAGAEVDVRDSSGETPLITAAYGSPKTVALLISRGADPNVIDKNGVTALVAGIRSGEKEVVDLLLASGADPEAGGATLPLYAAAREGRVDFVSALLAAGADRDVSNNRSGWTPLHISAIKGYGEIVRLLIDAGANVNLEDLEGNTPLLLASKYENRGVAKLLIAGGGRVTDTMSFLSSSHCLDRVLGSGEAYIWYLGHSGWAIKTQNHLLIFDYYADGVPPDLPSLSNGRIDTEEVAGRKVSVFVTHDHGDHFDKTILGWKDYVEDLTYIFGFEADTSLDYELIEPHEERVINGMNITTIESNDTGVGFVVEVDGLTLFHAGDHANRKHDFSGTFPVEIDHLATLGIGIDLAFMPVTGCGFGDRECVQKGVLYSIDKLAPNVLFPMHAGGNEHVYEEFAEKAVAMGVETPIGCARNDGDRFFYGKDGLM